MSDSAAESSETLDPRVQVKIIDIIKTLHRTISDE